jgi:hypothetical protein
MPDIAVLEKRLLNAATLTTMHQNVKLTGDALQELKKIIGNGILKLESMEMADNEPRIDAMETSLCLFVTNLSKEAKSDSNDCIDDKLLQQAANQGSFWPFY